MKLRVFKRCYVAAIALLFWAAGSAYVYGQPTITITQHPYPYVDVMVGNITGSLVVVATVTEGAKLSYQWYENKTATNTGGDPIQGATSDSFEIPTSLPVGTYYFYCVVSAEGAKSVASNATTLTVWPPLPVITIVTQPAPMTHVTEGSITGALTVGATVTEQASLTYQWFESQTNSNANGEAITGATSSAFTIPTTLGAGTYYYYCEVWTAELETPEKSEVAVVQVASPLPVITITQHPYAYVDLEVGKITGSLYVVATVTEGAKPSYQWYQNKTATNTGGDPIRGATSDSFVIPASLEVGTYYFYCVVSAEGALSVASNATTLTVWPPLPVITIVTQPAPMTHVTEGSITGALTVGATVTEQATLTYQWFESKTNSNANWEAITGATSSAFTIPTTLRAGTYYYYCEVWTAELETPEKSEVAVVQVASPLPVITITQQPLPVTVTEGSIKGELTVKATVTQGAGLSYQWYNCKKDGSEPKLIDGETLDVYTLPNFLTVGEHYFLCEVSVTDKEIAVRTEVVTVTVIEVVNAQTPTITTHPVSATYGQNETAKPLTVTATVTDGGTLSYQWYQHTVNSNSGGTAIQDAKSSSFTPPTKTAGTMYYYVVVTNTNNGVNGAQTATRTSSVASVTVEEPLVDAQTPTITAHPLSATYVQDETAKPLTVTATVTDGGTLSYQWFQHTVNSNSGGTPIRNGTSSSLTPPTYTIGTMYYYVVVGNTNNSVNGEQIAITTSNVAAVTVEPLVHAQAPTITTHPESATYTQNATAAPLSVTASSPDGGTLTYRWYVNTVNNNAGGTAILDVTSSTFTPPTNTTGTRYYYVVVTNTNNSVNGVKTATRTSSVAEIEVNTLINAPVPVIVQQPSGAVYDLGATAYLMYVDAEIFGAGTLSFQWYRNTANSNSGGTAISGATSPAYTPPTTTVGAIYYYVVVTCTNNEVSGNKTASTTSNTAEITVRALVDAQTPIITFQPVSHTYRVGDTATPLTLTANVTDGGTLSYQWYSHLVDDNNHPITSSTAISGATGASYTPSTSEVGRTVYFVEVTNTNNSVSGSKTAVKRSSAALIEVVAAPVVHAQEPIITLQPGGNTYKAGDTAMPLTVTANVTDGGTLSYQWFSVLVDDNNHPITSETAISGATGASYTPSTSEVGRIVYYVEVTNTNNSVSGSKTAIINSDGALIEVVAAPVVHAETPIITLQPVGTTYMVGDTATPLTVMAYVTDGGTLSYQWFSCLIGEGGNSITPYTAISGATGSSYTPPTDVMSNAHYYVLITNTNLSVNGNKSVAIGSMDVAIRVMMNDAQMPTITLQPAGKVSYRVGSTAAPLTVTASVTDGGTLSYQWHSFVLDTNNVMISPYTAISGATGSSYTPSTSEVGITHYCVYVTNTIDSEYGPNRATIVSSDATFTVDPQVPIITHEPGDLRAYEGFSFTSYPSPLFVMASVTDGGTLSYQWYSCLLDDNHNPITPDTAISGATDALYTPPTDVACIRSYYADITNTHRSATGIQTVTIHCAPAIITIIPAPQVPIIKGQPVGGHYYMGQTADPLTVDADVTDGGTLSYRWYSCLLDNNGEPITFFTLIEGAISASYTPPTDEMVHRGYQVRVVNTLDSTIVGVRERSILSDVAEIFVWMSALVPVVTEEPVSAVYTQHEEAVPLTVTASSVDGGTLSYQWYSLAPGGYYGEGTAIEGATEASYTPPTTEAGQMYYYVVIFNTNDKVNGAQTASASGRAAMIIVLSDQQESIPLFAGLEDTYDSGDPEVTLYVGGKGSEKLTIFKVDGEATATFNPSAPGKYRIEASSADGKLKIWKYVTVK